MAKDFRADRIRTGVLIGSASVGQPGILIYSSSVANDFAGNRTDSDMLSDVGRDVGVFVSGSKGHMVGNEWYPLNTAAHASDFKAGVFLVGGDFHVSGTIRAEHIVAELDPTATGSLYLSGALYVGKGATINTWVGSDGTHDFKVMGPGPHPEYGTIIFADAGTGKVSIGGSTHSELTPRGTLELGSGSTGDSNLVIHSSNAKSSSIEFWHGGTVGARISQSGSGGSEDLYIDNLAVGEATIFRSTISSPGHPSESMRITGGSSAKDVAVSVGGAAVLTASVFQVDAFNGFNRTGILVNTEQNSTSYPGIKVYAPATVGAVINANYGLSVTQNASNGYAAAFLRNQAEAGSQPLVSITEENASNTQIALKIRQDGTGDILGLYDSATEVFVVEDGGYVGIGSRAGKAAYNLDVGFDVFGDRDVGLRLECHVAQSASISFSGHSTAVGPAIVYEGTSTTGDGNFVIVHSSSNKEIRIKNHNDTMFARFREPVDDKAQVLILSGGGFLSSDPSTYADANFVVSGSVNSRTGSTRGTAVFMGDMHVSGNISSDLTNFGQWGRSTSGGAHLYPLQAPTDSIAIGKTSAVASPGTADIYLSSSGHAVFNERGNNVDFRVESNNETHMFFVTASDRIGIGTSNPSSFLSVDTNTQASGVRRGVHLGHDYGGDTYSAKEDSPTLTVRWLKNAVKDTNVFIESAEANSASILLKNYDSLGAISSAAGLVHGRETAGSGAKTLTLVNSQSSGGDLLFKAGSNSTHPTTMLRMKGAGSGVNSKVTFNEDQADLDFLVKSSARPAAFKIDSGKDKVLILSGGAVASPNESNFEDVSLFVSGAKNTRYSDQLGLSLFGGDVAVSGAFYGDGRLQIGTPTGLATATRKYHPGTAEIYASAPELNLTSQGNSSSGSLYFREQTNLGSKVSFKISAGGGLGSGAGSDNQNGAILCLTGSYGAERDIVFQTTPDGGVANAAKEMIRIGGYTQAIGFFGVSDLTGSKIDIICDEDATGLAQKHGMTLVQNETGGNKSALVIDSAGGGVALSVTGKKPAYLKQDISSGYGLTVYRDISEAGSNPLVTFQDDNTTNTQATLRVRQDGTGNIAEFQDAASTAFVIADGGHVGIKNAYPVAQLVVGDGTSARSIHIDAGATSSGSLAFSKAGGTPGAKISFDSSENLILATTGSNGNNKDIIFQVNDGGTDTEVFRVDGSESTVAIGATSNNTAKLLVKVESTENHHGIKIDQDDTGERALWIDSEGQAAYVTCKEGIQVIVDQDDGYGFLTSRNKSTVSDPLVKIRDQLGDQSALKVIQESKDSDAYAIEIGNIGGTTTSISGSGQVGIGVGNSTYDAILHIKGIERGDGIVLEDADSSDTVVKIYESLDDGVIDVYQNNAVDSRIHGNGTSFIGNSSTAAFGLGTSTPVSEFEIYSPSTDQTTVMISAVSNSSGSLAFRKNFMPTAAAIVLDSNNHFNLINSGSGKNIILETLGSSAKIIASGTLMAPTGLSGSLTTLTDGTPYLRPGNNITIESGSADYITITAADGGDTSASYLVLSATSSLDNERVFTEGTGLAITDAGAGGAFTVAVDYAGADSFILAATDGTGITVDSSNDKLALYDNDAGVVKYVNANQVGNTYTAGDGLDLTGLDFSVDLKSGGGLEIESTELSVDNSVIATLTGSIFSGKVGIHTGSNNSWIPDAQLEVRSVTSGLDAGIIITAPTDASGSLIFRQSGTGATKGALVYDPDESLVLVNSSSNDDIIFKYNDGGTRRQIQIDASENQIIMPVGVGTAGGGLSWGSGLASVTSNNAAGSRLTIESTAGDSQCMQVHAAGLMAIKSQASAGSTSGEISILAGDKTSIKATDNTGTTRDGHLVIQGGAAVMEVVVNESARDDIDFRVETGGSDKAIYVDANGGLAGTGEVHIGGSGVAGWTGDFNVHSSARNRTLFVDGQASKIGILLNDTATDRPQAELQIGHGVDNAPMTVLINVDGDTSGSFAIAQDDGATIAALTVDPTDSVTLVNSGSNSSLNLKTTSTSYIVLNSEGTSEPGSDVNLLVSGAISSKDGSTRGTSLFLGDVHISGSLTSDNTSFGQWTDGGSFIYPADSSGAETVIIGANTTGAANIVLGSDGATQFNKQNAAVDFRVRSENKSYTLFVDGDKDAVTVGRQNLFGDDAFLNVSGSILSRGVTSDRGLAVFGGDTYVSGALLLNKLGTTPVQGNIGSNTVGIYAKDDSGTTKLFYMDDAGTEVQVGSGGGGGGPGDANATFLLVSATGSLNAERVLAGGAGISTTDGGAGNSFTVAVDYAGADSFILAATDGTGITVDGDNDKLVIYDNDAAVVKYVNAGQVGKTYTAGDGLDLSGTEFSLDLKSSGGLVIDSTELAVSNAVVATLTGSQFSGNVGVTGSFGVTGGALFKGNVTLGNATGDDLTFTGYAASSIIPKTDNTYDLGSSGNRWANIYTGDLHLRNDKGNWTIQEDSDKLIVINNLTGKKYKMMLSPLEDEE